MELVTAVNADVLREINEYLDVTNDAEEAVPFGDLAQAAIEAEVELRNRDERQ